MALNPRSTLPVPMISVTSCKQNISCCAVPSLKLLTLGSLGSRMATLMPNSEKKPLA